MANKLSLVCLVAILIVAYSNYVDATHCSLEKMKTFAAEACEHLFLNDESVRQKRAYHHKSKHNDFGHHHRKHAGMLAVRRSSFPAGGYLKVASRHIDFLQKLDIYPMYKVHSKKKGLDGDRHKRDSYGSAIGVPYCCYNKCDEDFFC